MLIQRFLINNIINKLNTPKILTNHVILNNLYYLKNTLLNHLLFITYYIYLLVS